MTTKSLRKQLYLLLIFFFFVNKILSTRDSRLKHYRSELDCSCRLNERIVGGIETEENEFPWHVALVDTVTRRAFCGGVLINNQYVITAGHCIKYDNCDEISVLVGKHNLKESSSKSQIIKAKECTIHPDYYHKKFYNDISIIKLAKVIQTEETKRPACFPEAGQNYTGRVATVIGWGRTSENGSSSKVLRKVDIGIADLDKCRKKFGNRKIKDSMICSTWDEGGKDSCGGDSGGPLMIHDGNKNYFIIGLVSFGIGCGRRKPAVYTRVDMFYKWMEESMEGKPFCSGYKTE